MAIAASVTAARAPFSFLAITIAGGIDTTLDLDRIVPQELQFLGALTANVNVTFPVQAVDAGQVWVIDNQTSGAFTLTIGAATGATVQVAQGKRAAVQWDGTNFKFWISDPAGVGAAGSGANTNITSLAGITGGITAAGGLNIAGQVGGNSATPGAFQWRETGVSFASDANHTASAAEYSCPSLNCTSGVSLTVTRNLVLPLTAGAFWIIFNNTSGGQAIQAIGGSGTGVLIGNGRRAVVKADGTNITYANDDFSTLNVEVGPINAVGGMNISGAVGGNSATPGAFTFAASAPNYASDANKTLSAAEYAAVFVVVTGTISVQRNLVVPLTGFWIVTNSTTGGFGIQVIGASGTGIVIANGKTAIVRGNGVNILRVAADNP